MSLRLLHTADWHLGQLFHGYDRDHEHGRFLDWLLATLAARRPDALLIAGDIFDSINPSSQALRRFYEFLSRAHAAHPALQIVITAGNHDAAARLEAPAQVLRHLNIRVIGTVVRDAAGVIQPQHLLAPLTNAEGQVEAVALAVPFLRHADVPALPDAHDPYLDGVRELFRLAASHAREVRDAQHPGAALVALAHCHLTGGEESRDSERRLIIGGSESLQIDVFHPDLVYVALGHLHKPQHFDDGRLCYSGSPLPLSFSEQHYEHRVVLVTLEHGRRTAVETLPIPKTASLLRVPAVGAAPLADVLALLRVLPLDAALAPAEQPFLEVHVLDDGPDPTRRHRIETALADQPVRLASIKLVPLPRSASLPAPGVPVPSLADLTSLDAAELLADAHRERYGTEADPALLTALREILAAESVENTPSASA